eukprot:GHVH01012210.1.p1 GENE.GHVH01012210.1~~GHVH01012210.1.p1  ORF type:complete len:552 (+),score=73.06 GHVH01012210.1:64-1719(+)
MMVNLDAVSQVDKRYPRPVDAEFLIYGTAGFRDKASKLTHAMARCGAIAVLTSLQFGCKHVGMMITASHNPAPDNGVKLVSFDGSMVKPDIESIAVKLVNSPTFVEDLDRQIQLLSGDSHEILPNCTVVIGRDTRESSKLFSTSASEMVRALGAKVVDLGVVTTPQLHFGVWHQNRYGSLGTPDVYKTYFATRLNECYPDASNDEPSKLMFDGACGVGALHVGCFTSALEKIKVDLCICNGPNDGELNLGCGSDFVQTSQAPPARFTFKGVRCASVDGDADRIVYHHVDECGTFHLIDGDKIAALYLMVINRMILDCDHSKFALKPLAISVVQTAYANGASTIALEKVKSDPASMTVHPDVECIIQCSKTGVKNLHHIAEESDISVYFEANGHGTVIFNEENLMAWAKERCVAGSKPFKRLLAFLGLFNASVGDAFTDLLACEVGLKMLNMSIGDWSAIYSSLSCSQSKVYLPKDKMALIQPHPDHERWLTSPIEIQTAIDKAVGLHSTARAFIRPSGTEPLVRLYVEAETDQARDEIVTSIKEYLSNYFN